MLSREHLRQITVIEGNGTYFVSLYLNVNPVTNPKGDYVIWFKNALKSTAESLEKAVFKRVEKDLNAIDAYVLGNRRDFKKGLVLLSSSENSFWRKYNLSVPLKSELIVNKAPYIKPLLDVLDNYRRYAVLLVEKDSARIFTVHLGEITEYGKVHTPDVPGRHKKGGWFALSQSHYERHIEYHVGLHLKDVVKRLGSFLKDEGIDGLVVGGSEEAVLKTKELLPGAIAGKTIGNFNTGMFENTAGILKKVEPVLEKYERQKGKEMVTELINRTMKNDRAVIGVDDVLNALQEGKVKKLILLRDFSREGFQCSDCSALLAQGRQRCPYCGGKMEGEAYIVELAAQRAVEQDAVVQVVSDSEGLEKAGGIGAFLRF